MRRAIPALCALLLLAPPAAALDAKPLIYSLLLPGLGEWSLGYKGRAVGFWAVEAGCWAGNFYYRDRGFDLRHEYEAYADAHWHTARWASAFSEEQPGWLAWMPAAEYDANAWAATCPVAVDFDTTHAGYLQSHFAPYHEDPQHYYENLGKYDWYRWGWDDYDCAADDTAHRWVYVGIRNDSEKAFDTARLFANALVVSRVVSLVDTYLLLRRLERAGGDAAPLETAWRLDFAPTGRGAGGFRIALTRSW